LTECEKGSVTAGTQRLYDHHVALFGRWVAKRPADLDLDTNLVDYLDTLLADGYPSGDGEKAVAAVIAATPGTDRRQLPRTTRALKGFRKKRPPRSRLPIPEEVMAGIVAFLWHRGEHTLALFVMTLFYGYFRPGEGRGFLCMDLNLPAGGPQESLNCVSLTVAPETRLEWSKTQTFDDTVLLDAPVRYLGNLLVTLRGERPPSEPLFLLGQDAHTNWSRACRALGLPGLVLYQLRHGGASVDRLERRRSPQEILARGRWQSERSLRRYAKSGRVQTLLGKLAPHVREFTKVALRDLELVVTGRRRLAPPAACLLAAR